MQCYICSEEEIEMKPIIEEKCFVCERCDAVIYVSYLSKNKPNDMNNYNNTINKNGSTNFE